MGFHKRAEVRARVSAPGFGKPNRGGVVEPVSGRPGMSVMIFCFGRALAVELKAVLAGTIAKYSNTDHQRQQWRDGD